jgi:hypothetical protein
LAPAPGWTSSRGFADAGIADVGIADAGIADRHRAAMSRRTAERLILVPLSRSTGKPLPDPMTFLKEECLETSG